METLQKKMKWKEFRDMNVPEDDTSIYELINGVIVKRASPNSPHQRALRKLFLKLGNLTESAQLGELFCAPYDVYFDEESAGVQPDILFVSNERSHIINENNGIVGVPDLIVEIVSKGSIDKDREVKKKLYRRFAVQEYWIVDPQYKTIEVYIIKKNDYHLVSFAEEKGKIKSEVLKGLHLDVDEVFG